MNISSHRKRAGITWMHKEHKIDSVRCEDKTALPPLKFQEVSEIKDRGIQLEGRDYDPGSNSFLTRFDLVSPAERAASLIRFVRTPGFNPS
jgi:hypothetical protein